MEREYGKQKKRERKRRRRRGVGSSLAIAAAVLAVFLLGVLTGGMSLQKLMRDGGSEGLHIFTETAIEDQDFVPLEKILQLDGYELSENAGETAGAYEKKAPKIRLEVSQDLTEVKKNDYTFEVKDSVVKLGNALYMKREALEHIINKQISRDDKGVYSLTEEELEAHAWASGEIPLIAHAGSILEKQEDGQWKQFTYTNSREALISNYDNGYRVIEMDFQLSADDVLCGLHSWEKYDGAMTSEKWLEQKIEDRYTTLTFPDVLEQMAVNLDLYVVLDVKSYEWEDDEVVRQYQKIYDQAEAYGGEQLVDRLIPQIYRQEEYELVGEVYDWKSIIYTLYRSDKVEDEDIISFVEGKDDIRVVTVPKRRISKEFCTLLHEAGKSVYTHTINDTDGLYDWMNEGVDGFYTDTMTPDAYRARYF